MNIVVTGGTGFVGRHLIGRLLDAGHTVTLLSRNPSKAAGSLFDRVRAEQWDAKTLGAWAACVDGADGVINLAGELIGGRRWTGKEKERILNSRVQATSAVVEAMRRARKKPSVLVNASGVGYYGHVESGDVTEDFPKGNDFLAGVVDRWEQEARRATEIGVRVVTLRCGVILGKKGGALPKLLLPFKLFVGGSLGPGTQWFPWVHQDDAIRAYVFALESSHLAGVVNVAAPEPATMKEFCKSLAKVMGRPCWLAVPGFLLRMALGEMASIVLAGQKVIPKRLLEAGFQFRYTHIEDALKAILKKT